MLSKKLIKSLVTPGKDEVCQAGAEKRPRTIICQAAEDDACKGSRHERKVQFLDALASLDFKLSLSELVSH